MQNLKVKTTRQKSKLLLATTNDGKIKEYREIFKQLGLKIQSISLKDLAITEKIEEDGKTFKENAIKKAKFYCKLSGLPTLADDGGIEIDYLSGEPGVRSRRWPGYEATDEELRQMTFAKLEGVPWEKRGARLRVVIAITLDGEKVHTFEGVWRGYIVENQSKAAKLMPGYPFRSVFYLPEQNKVLGELPFEEEVKLGHRMRALRAALSVLRELV